MTKEPLPPDMETLVFVPAGDGVPTQSKKLGDLDRLEFER